MTSLTENASSIRTVNGRTTRQACNVASPLRPESRKLRASCDNCYLAKIRCSKEMPTCTRCIRHGYSCRYSPSQRMGKPRKFGHERSASQTSIKTRGSASLEDRSTGSPSMRKPESVPPFFDWNFEQAMTSAGSQGSSDTAMSQEVSLAWQQALDNIPSNRSGIEESDRSPRFPFPNVMKSVGLSLKQTTYSPNANRLLSQQQPTSTPQHGRHSNRRCCQTSSASCKAA